MRREAIASDSVKVGSSPSGTLATMMPMAKTKFVHRGTPSASPVANTSTPATAASTAMTRLSHVSSCCSGDGTSSATCARRAILPNSVRIPVASTSARALPDTTVVPASRLLRLRRASPSTSGRASRASGCDSPVSVLMSTRSENAWITRQSADRLSPASTSDHVAGHEPFDGDPRGTAVAQGRDLRWQQALQRAERLLRPVLLPEREQPVDENHRDNGQRQRPHPVSGIAQVRGQRQQRRQPEHDGEEVRELAEELQRTPAPAGPARCDWGRTRRAASRRPSEVRPSALLRRLASASSTAS